MREDKIDHDEWMSLDELRQTGESFSLELTIPPYVDGQVYVNAREISEAMEFARLRSLRIANEKEDIQPTITGVNATGEAFGSFATPATSAQRVDLNPANDPIFTSITWNNVVCAYDMNRLKRNITENADIRNPNDWAMEVDVLIRDAINRASFKSLTHTNKFEMEVPLLLTLGLFMATPFSDWFDHAASNVMLALIVNSIGSSATDQALKAYFGSGWFVKSRYASVAGFDLGRLTTYRLLNSQRTFSSAFPKQEIPE